MLWNGLPLIIFGSGGISKEVYNLIKDINRSNNQKIYDFIGFVGATNDEIGNEIIENHKVVTSDENIIDFVSKYALIGIIVPIGNPKIKANIYDKIKNIKNSVFPNIIHPNIMINEKSVKMGMGNIITAGVNMTCDIKIGNFNLINLNSTIGHDTEIGDFNVINPLVAVSGNVNIKNECLVGTGAQILQGLRISDNSTIGAGAVVVKDILESNTTVVGIPAKPIKWK